MFKSAKNIDSPTKSHINLNRPDNMNSTANTWCSLIHYADYINWSNKLFDWLPWLLLLNFMNMASNVNINKHIRVVIPSPQNHSLNVIVTYSYLSSRQTDLSFLANTKAYIQPIIPQNANCFFTRPPVSFINFWIPFFSFEDELSPEYVEGRQHFRNFIMTLNVSFRK